jgi:hypothetical protein
VSMARTNFDRALTLPPCAGDVSTGLTLARPRPCHERSRPAGCRRRQRDVGGLVPDPSADASRRSAGPAPAAARNAVANDGRDRQLHAQPVAGLVRCALTAHGSHLARARRAWLEAGQPTHRRIDVPATTTDNPGLAHPLGRRAGPPLEPRQDLTRSSRDEGTTWSSWSGSDCGPAGPVRPPWPQQCPSKLG